MKVEWAGPAILDVRAIKAYISKDSEAYATRFAERIIEAAEIVGAPPAVSVE
jgi:plasmid stabilization system protein ParE